MNNGTIVAPPRIGNGTPLFVIGALLLAFGVFAALAGADGAGGASAIGGIAITLGGAIIAVGFWVNLFSKIEARLIDIQQSITQMREGQLQDESVDTIVAKNEPTSSAEPELMAKLGITFDGEKYLFGEYKYDALQDAVNYARKQASAT